MRVVLDARTVAVRDALRSGAFKVQRGRTLLQLLVVLVREPTFVT